MKHLGDITKINGAEIEPVDVITFGSPCQDLSVAGKRAGLDGERSGLFMEAVRIIKEMRNASSKTNDNIRLPRFAIWENVPGAFSSNKGEDFRVVLEELARIIEPDITIPKPEKGKWSKAGCISGDGWSIAWRCMDAQFWGVPQRRKRIALVADFGGPTAPDLLFEQVQAVTKGLSRNSKSSKQEGQEVAGDIGESLDSASTAYTLKIRGGREIDSLGHKAGKGALVQTELSGTLGVSQDQTLIAFEPGAASSVESDVSYTLNSTEHHAVCVGNGQMCNITMKPVANTLDTMHDQQAVITYGLDRASFNQGKNAQYDFSIEEDLAQTVLAKGPGGGVLTQEIKKDD